MLTLPENLKLRANLGFAPPFGEKFELNRHIDKGFWVMAFIAVTTLQKLGSCLALASHSAIVHTSDNCRSGTLCGT